MTEQVHTLAEARQSVIDQMAAVGIIGPVAHELDLSGKRVNFANANFAGKARKAWYRLSVTRYFAKSGDEIELISGAFGDWRLQGGTTKGGGWAVKMTAPPMSAEERKRLTAERRAIKQRAERDAAERHSKAGAEAERLWRKLAGQGEDAARVRDAEYLQRKRVGGYGVRVSQKGTVVVPMRDVQGKLWGLQLIRPRGLVEQQHKLGKEFFPVGLNMAGTYHHIGAEPAVGDPVVIVEGYATGASVHMATGYTVIVAFNTAKLADVVKAIRGKYPGRRLIIGADDDVHKVEKRPADMPPIHNAGIEAAKKAAGQFDPPLPWIMPDFSGFARSSGDETGNGGDVDFNDLHVLGGQAGLERIAEQFDAALNPVGARAPRQEDWMIQLSRDEKGRPKSSLGNIAAVLQNDKRWRGVIGWDDMTGMVVKMRPPPLPDESTGPWTDSDTTALRVWCEQRWEMSPGKDDTNSAVEMVAELNRFHRLRDWLSGLEWDGKARLAELFSYYAGADQDDSTYLALVGRYFMIGSVARVMGTAVKPGLKTVKMDNMIVLEGKQGLGKSTFARELFGDDYFSDAQLNLSDQKQAAEIIKGKWCVELPEMDAFYKAESTAAKAFISQESDRYRPAYARNASEVPRQCVFVGTVNSEAYLKDPTGNRRYWPVRCGAVRLDDIRANREQLWAEAVALYRQGVGWWVTADCEGLFEAEQSKRMELDSWHDVIAEWQHDRTQHKPGRDQDMRYGGAHWKHWTIKDIMINALDIEANRQTKQDQRRVKTVLEELGWRWSRLRSNDHYEDNKRVWVRPDPPPVARVEVNDDAPF